jgi:hypothetical protein
MGFEQLFRDRNNAMGNIFEMYVVFTSIELRVETEILEVGHCRLCVDI